MTLQGKTGLIVEVNTDFGPLRFPADRGVVVGDRLVPPEIEVDFPGGGDQPALRMRIEMIEGVPRCTELSLKRNENGGREIRSRDLRNIVETSLDEWIEVFVSLCSRSIVSTDGSRTASQFGGTESDLRQGMRTIQDTRRGSRRPMTGERRQRVADVYNAHESGGLEAIAAAFNVSRSTAVRYLRAARAAGLIRNGKA